MKDQLRYYIDGPGEVLITTTDFDFTNPDPNKIIAVVTCKSASISGSADMEDVTGGRSLFPKRRFKTSQSATLELTDCEMDFRYASLTSGEDIETGATEVWAFGSDYKFVIPTTAPFEIQLPNSPIADSLIVRLDDGSLMEAATEADAGKYSLNGDKLTFAEADKGKEVELVYKYMSAAGSKSVSTLADSVPKTVKAIHKQPTFDNDNKVTGTQFIEFFKLQTSPEFREDYQERAAYAPQITFELLDPQRPDKKIFKRTWEPVTPAAGG